MCRPLKCIALHLYISTSIIYANRYHPINHQPSKFKVH